MIVQVFIDVVFNFVAFLISVFPKFVLLSIPWTGLADVIGYGIHVIGSSTFALVTANILLWSGIHFAVAVGDWVYNKIPFI